MLGLLFYTAPLAVIGVVGGMIFWKVTEKDRIIEEQKRVIAELNKKLDRVWAEELVADVRVNAVNTDAAGRTAMDLTFIQYQPGTEKPAFQRTMTLPGEEFYIDALVVKFDRPFIEGGDALRGKSLLLFRRAFGDQQKPVDGVPLFRQSGELPIPEVAQLDENPSEFEREIWAKFWDIANDPTLAAAHGIRGAQGEAPHVRAVVGQVYKLTLRASDGLQIVPRLPAAVVGSGTATGADAGSARPNR